MNVVDKLYTGLWPQQCPDQGKITQRGARTSRRVIRSFRLREDATIVK